MGNSWSNLHGQQLSAFAASVDARAEEESFAEHLEQYGTNEDFAHWIEQKEIPMFSAIQMFNHCPTRACPWVIAELKSPQPNVHYAVAVHLGSSKKSQEVSAPVKQVLHSVNYAILAPESLKNVYDVLIHSKVFDVIEANWTAFEPLVKAKAEQSVLQAAAQGWDLHDTVGAPTNRVQYFRACASGGLINRVQQYRLDPSETQAITQAFIVCALRHESNPEAMAPILHYLWDTYPNQPWHTVEEMLGLAAHAPVSVAQRIATHYQQHAPETLTQHAEGLVCHAIYAKKKELFDTLLPYVNATDHHKLFYNAIYNKRKTFLKTLLQRTADDGHAAFFTALEKCTTKDQQWASDFYTTQQKMRLQDKLQDKRISKRAPTKKM